MTGAHDAIVVGAGFAGLVTARELSLRGFDVLVVEARDRIGGRTWTAERLGRRLDLGGSYVHWLQPHVWSEITRYGLAISETMTPARAAWATEGVVKHGTPADLEARLDRANVLLLGEARRYFARPYEPLRGDELPSIDALSVEERIRSLDLSSEERDVLTSFWALNFSGLPGAGAFTQALRWCSVASGSWSLMFEACGSFKLVNGTAELADAILADSHAELRLGARVDAIDWNEAGVEVTTANGDVFLARAATVTLPLNVLCSIRYSPGLSAAKVHAANEGQASQGLKVWARLRGRDDPFVVMGMADWPINLAYSEYYVDGDTLVAGFGSDAGALDPNDRAAVQDAIRRWWPDAEVQDSCGHDWVGDPYSGETWGMQRPGQLTGALADLQTPEGPVVFAGSDYANGWAGFIDGAIESGLTATRELVGILSADGQRQRTKRA
jgi:monoamine oxidase